MYDYTLDIYTTMTILVFFFFANLFSFSLLNDPPPFTVQQGKDDEAEPLHNRALQLREALLGSRHPDVATSLEFLARMALKRGKWAGWWEKYI